MRHTLVCCLLLPTAACSDAGLYAGKTPHSDPLVSILSPADGAVVSVDLVAEGSVAAPDDPAAVLVVDWAVDGTAVCPEAAPDADGLTTCALSLSPGPATLALTVTDAVGARARAEVQVTVEAADVNGAPGAPEVELLPDPPVSSDDLQARLVEATDPDADPLTYVWQWTRDGAVVPELTGDAVPAAHTARDEQWTVTVYATDGTLDGPSATAGPVTILNGPPTGGSLTLSPAEPEAGLDDLLCEVSEDAVDPDADPVDYSVAWSVDGVAWTGPTTTTYLEGDGVPGVETREDELWRCEVLPTDGALDGSLLVAEVVPRSCAWFRERDSPFTYGSVTDPRTGLAYRTIVIGSQTWMADNITYGTRVDGVDGLTDNGVAEQWCYGDDDAWCLANGGIYNRSEAIAWAPITEEAVQGVCPSGWHVPTLGEFEVLLSEAGTSRGLVDVCEGDRSGTDTVGFAARMVGVRSWGSFEREGVIKKFWTSTDRGSGGYSYNMVVGLNDNTFEPMVESGANAGENGFSVRCIQD